jgi:DUF971 family protein
MQPTELRLSPDKRTLTVVWTDTRADLAAEYLRVESPSAEVKGHGPSDARLVGGKQNVTIRGLEPVGAYAVKILFSDGHETGLYTWSYLQELATEHPTRWKTYLTDLERTGLNRETAATVARTLAHPSKRA